MNSLPPNISKLIGQMIMVGIKGHNRDAVYDFFERNYKYHVGGIILYDEDITTNPPSLHNIRSQQQLSNFTNYLQEFSSNPLLIGIDQEGGKVNRLKEIYGFPKTISWSKLGNINDLKKTELESNNIAKSLNRCGINVNFSPVLDLDISKDNIISQKDRAISSDYKVVFEHAQTSIKCHLDHDIIAVGKHFPGQGSSQGDTHQDWVDVSDTWSDQELRPYNKLIQANNISAIMTSHLYNKHLDKKYPATLSKNIINDLLRREMNFKGVVISDDPQMEAISSRYKLERIIELMICAGVDIFCFGNNLVYDPDIVKKIHHVVLRLLKDQKIDVSMLEKSNERIMKLKSKIGLL